LATVVLKCVAPGVPDFYQGSELFDFTLTDPDNRRPIGFASRRTALSRLPEARDGIDRSSALRDMVKRGDSGPLKLYVTRSLLHLRRAHRELFDRGSYQALTVTGPLKVNAVALARRQRGDWVVACIPRQTLSAAGPGRFPTGTMWKDTSLRLPKDAPRHFEDVLSGRRVSAKAGRLELAECFSDAPVSVLVGVAVDL
jgi:(1->4)-alpha-D-glucan 1-alpha-D-glucosylmutase